jgi:hypothetical protein
MDGDASHFAQAMNQCAKAFGNDLLAHAVETSNAIQHVTSVPLSNNQLS